MDDPNDTLPAQDDLEDASDQVSTDDAAPVASEDGADSPSVDEAAPEESPPASEDDQPLTPEVVAEDGSTTEPDSVDEDDSSESTAEVEEVVEEVVEETLDEMELRAESEGVSMMELLLREGDYLPERIQRGDLVEGVVVTKERNQLTINIGAKQDGVVPSSDVMRLPPGHFDSIGVGDEVKAIVIRPENSDGEVLVSIHQALSLTDWSDAQALMESGEIIELEIVGFNKGGVLVGYGNLQGFLPRSHLSRLAGREQGAAERLAEFIGEKIPVKIIEVERKKRRLIMSERLALREWRADQKKKLLSELTEGEIRTGRVSSIADFGAFVDLGGADGLVHVSELTYERGKHPRDVVKVGQEVNVYVLHVDHERSRIGLSMKRLIEDPWANVEESHYVGELAEGTISNLADFGAFARLEDGLEGLIHISELSDVHVEHPNEVVKVGQNVTVEVISIEPDRQRIGLSIRRVPEHLRVGLVAEGGEGEAADGDETEGEEASAELDASASDAVASDETAADDASIAHEEDAAAATSEPESEDATQDAGDEVETSESQDSDEEGAEVQDAEAEAPEAEVEEEDSEQEEASEDKDSEDDDAAEDDDSEE